MELIEITILIIQGLLVVVMALGGYIIKKMDGRIDTLEKDVRGMKDNYLTRFERVISNQNDAKAALIEQHTQTKEELLAAFNDLKLYLTQNFEQKKKGK